MNTPDFTTSESYTFSLRYPDGTLKAGGTMNSKAWFKTIENGVIWEFIKENGRVIEYPEDTFCPDLNNTEIKGNEIVIPMLSQKERSAKNGTTGDIMHTLEEIVKKRKREMPENSYTTHLFTKGEDKILKKLGEEAVEVILAKGKNEEIVYESADLIYHLMVYLVYKEIPFDSILDELAQRMIK